MTCQVIFGTEKDEDQLRLTEQRKPAGMTARLPSSAAGRRA